jgi:hypothetical protein
MFRLWVFPLKQHHGFFEFPSVENRSKLRHIVPLKLIQGLWIRYFFAPFLVIILILLDSPCSRSNQNSDGTDQKDVVVFGIEIGIECCAFLLGILSGMLSSTRESYFRGRWSIQWRIIAKRLILDTRAYCTFRFLVLGSWVRFCLVSIKVQFESCRQSRIKHNFRFWSCFALRFENNM